MGLLDYISQKAKAIPDNAKAAYRGLLAAPEELAALFSPGMLKGVNQAMNTPATLDSDKMVGMAMDYLQTTPAGLLGHIAAQKSSGLLGKVDNAGMGYVVNSRGSMGHEIVKDGKVVGLVKTGKAKDAIGTFMKQQNDALMAKKAKAEAAKASSSNRAARKAEIEALISANTQYADVISSVHKNKNLEFTPLPDGVFGLKGNPLIHQSRSYGKKPGSSYKLVMVDGKPAYARESDHWGEFSTNDFVNGEPVSNTYNWPLSGVETKPYGDIRRAGYVFLDDLLKK